MNGKVYLVGAGPGDPSLLTLKARDLLRQAGCVIYDALVNPDLLLHAPPEAELIYAGKRGGERSIAQEQINRWMIEKALEGKTVVRLKGGDPFVFGRGGEEAEALGRAGIHWEVVPGVSSAIAVPAAAGIPVTHRSWSSSVAIVSGQEDPNKPASRIRWRELAQGVDTLVFLMCAKTLPSIASNLIRNGCSPSTPVAVIQWGTYPHQKTTRGTLATIPMLAPDLEPPAIAVVGEVVRLSEQWRLCEEVLSRVS